MEQYKKDRKIGIITFILGIAFIMIACHVTAQPDIERIKRYTDKKDMVTYFSNSPIFFKNKADSMFVGVLVDSISDKLYETKFYAYLPKHQSGKLIIGFENGPPCEVFPEYIDSSSAKENYMEYIPDKKSLYYFISSKCSYIYFDGQKQYFVDYNKTNYFVDFFENIYTKHSTYYTKQ